MNNPTHFIEVYKGLESGIVWNSVLLPINYLDSQLDATKNIYILQTIAVWKIKAKPVVKPINVIHLTSLN